MPIPGDIPEEAIPGLMPIPGLIPEATPVLMPIPGLIPEAIPEATPALMPIPGLIPGAAFGCPGGHPAGNASSISEVADIERCSPVGGLTPPAPGKLDAAGGVGGSGAAC
eukprot:996541-Prorocentrum_minimum.AAC.1